MSDNAGRTLSSATPPNDPQSTEVEARSLSRWPITRPNGRPPLYVDLSNLAHSRFTTEAQRTEMTESIGRNLQVSSDVAAKVLGRPFHQEEAEATAFYSAKARRIAFNGFPAALAMTFALSWRGRRMFRFPLYTPKWTHCSPDRFLFFRGRMARGSWHAVRGFAYLNTAGLAAQMSFAGYGVVTAGTGQALDPRMKDHNELVRQTPHATMLMREERISQLWKDRHAASPAETRGDSIPETMRQQRSVQRDGEESSDGHGGVGSSFDDYYPDPYQQTDKKALLEAIRRADGKSVEGEDVPSSSFEAAPESQSSEISWDRLRQEAGRQSSQSLEPRSQDNGETHPDDTSHDGSEAQG